jgi:hypothetical protein
MAGRYHLVKEEDGELRPKKDKYSNLCDCLQYGCLSLGEGRGMTGLKPAAEVKPTRIAPARRHCAGSWHEQEARTGAAP